MSGKTGVLPTALTRFVGRRREIDHTIALLRQHRLVTLVGFGGVGKTRLAIRVASLMQELGDYRDGCVFVDLRAVHHTMTEQAALAALGLQPSGGSDLQALLTHLADKQLLMVLDNCEQLADDAGSLGASLLQGCPELTVLATGRIPLDIAGEHIVQVQPLTLPDLDETTATSNPEPEALTLLRDRAEEQGHSQALKAASPRQLAQLCHRLDGIPLAIELAVPSLAVLGVGELLARLNNLFHLLTDGGRRVLPGHRTLREVVELSAELCKPQERLLWQRLSVFAYAFDLDCAESVCADDELPREDVALVLARLGAQSILLTDHRSQRTFFRLLTPVQQYGLEKLQKAEQEVTLRRRHRDHVFALLTQGISESFGLAETEWLARLQRLLPEIRAAMQWSLATPGEEHAGCEIACAMTDTRVWWALGALTEGRWWLDHAIQTLERTAPQAAEVHVMLARAYAGNAWLTLTQGDPATAVRQMAQARQEADLAGQSVVQAAVAVVDGVQALLGDADPKALTLLVTARDTAVERGDLITAHMAGLFAAIGAATLGQSHQEAQPIINWCIADADAHEAGWSRWWARWPKGIALARWGDAHEATTLLREVTSALHSVGDRWGQTWGLWGLALAASAAGQSALAVRYLGAFGRGQEVTNVDVSRLGGFQALHAQILQVTHAALEPEQWQVAYEVGAAGGFDEAVATALAADLHTAKTDKLTTREREVAVALGAGLTNKQIAARFGISPRTAESHVEHILAKLNFTSRTQVAVWANENLSTH